MRYLVWSPGFASSTRLRFEDLRLSKLEGKGGLVCCRYATLAERSGPV